MTFGVRLNDAFEEMMKYRYSVGYATDTYKSSVPTIYKLLRKKAPYVKPHYSGNDR